MNWQLTLKWLSKTTSAAAAVVVQPEQQQSKHINHYGEKSQMIYERMKYANTMKSEEEENSTNINCHWMKLNKCEKWFTTSPDLTLPHCSTRVQTKLTTLTGQFLKIGCYKSCGRVFSFMLAACSLYIIASTLIYLFVCLYFCCVFFFVCAYVSVIFELKLFCLFFLHFNYVHQYFQSWNNLWLIHFEWRERKRKFNRNQISVSFKSPI